MMRVLCLVTLAIVSMCSHAVVISVDGRANGSFGGRGALNGAGVALVAGSTLFAGQQVTISATGTIHDGVQSLGPGGSQTTPTCCNDFQPLEETAFTAGILFPRASSFFQDLGALIGAFVDSSTVSAPGFSAISTTFGGNISASSLFLIGSGPFQFVAPTGGQLFFGVNDWFAVNNSGSFEVTVSRAVPEPEHWMLFLSGLTLLGYRRLRHQGRFRAKRLSPV